MAALQSLVQGERTTGADVRTQNVTAVAALANIVKSSLGPVGLDKVCARVVVVVCVFLCPCVEADVVEATPVCVECGVVRGGGLRDAFF
jgi:hypothetical protein